MGMTYKSLAPCAFWSKLKDCAMGTIRYCCNPDVQASEERKYEVSNSNPFESTENPFELGQELYKNGLLSEAVLAFEAAIGKASICEVFLYYIGTENLVL